MAFPPGFLDELRNRISLSGLVGRRVKLTRRGREHAGLCPFHHEKTPSFYVVDDKNFFHCFGCGAHGDAIGFVMRADNLDFLEAVEKLAGEAGLAVPQATPEEREKAQRQKTLLETLEAAAAFYEARLWGPAGGRARDYLQARGLDPDTIRRFRLGWASEDRQALRRALAADYGEALLVEAGLQHRREEGEPFDYFRNRVMFPIGDRIGRTIAFGGRTIGDGQPKYLNSPDTPIFSKGRTLYGWAAARAKIARDGHAGQHGVVVTEGYMDVIALHRAGFSAVAPLGTALMAPPLGTSLPVDTPLGMDRTEDIEQQDAGPQLQELWRLGPEPILCFDGDAAGQRAAGRALRRALPLLQAGRSLRFAILPSGDDPDSLIRRGGREAFAQIVAAARPLSRMLWELELGARPVGTPERRADLDRRLMEDVALIADPTVRNEYRRFMRDRLFDAGRKPRAMASSRRDLGFVVRGSPSPPRARGREQREILLTMLVEHPFLIAEMSEQIFALNFPEPELRRLRQLLLEIEASAGTMDSETARSYLIGNGFGDVVKALLSSPAIRQASRALNADIPDEIRLRANAAVKFLLSQDHSEFADAQQAFAMAPTDENLERLTKIKERELQQSAIERDGDESVSWPGKMSA